MNRADWAARLEADEKTLGFADGYKLLYSSWATLGTARAAFISLNPGGRVPAGAEMRVVSDERGNSYEVERHTTQSPITGQFLRLADFIGLKPAEILTGVAMPFRSDDWEGVGVGQKRGGLAFGRAFWKEALSRKEIRLVIACSDEAAEIAREAIGARLEAKFSSGWGSVSLRRYRAPDGRIVARLPHLSRFRLFGRPEAEAPLRRLLAPG